MRLDYFITVLQNGIWGEREIFIYLKTKKWNF